MGIKGRARKDARGAGREGILFGEPLPPGFEVTAGMTRVDRVLPFLGCAIGGVDICLLVFSRRLLSSEEEDEGGDWVLRSKDRFVHDYGVFVPGAWGAGVCIIILA